MPKRFMVPVTRRLALGAALLLTGGLAFTPAVHAQLPTSAFALSFPESLLSAIRSAGSGGVTWDVVRRSGLLLNVKGQGEYTVSVVALAVAKGRVTRVWASPKRQVAVGTITLPGRDFLPGDHFLQGIPKVLGDQAGRTLSVDDARKAISDAGNAATAGTAAERLLGSVSTSTNGVIFVMIPDGTGKSTTTNPRFARTETLSD